METIERDYAPKGVRFYYIYKSLAHPEKDGYVKAFTLDERLMHVKEAERRLGSRIPWLFDGMTDDLKRALGNVQNAELVVDPQGRIVRRRAWSDPDELRADLRQLVGKVEKPTRIEDLDLRFEPPPDKVATGIVPRVEVPGPMRALKIEPQLDDAKHPFYVKLRAEAQPELLRDGSGQVYLGFHLDPLYRVHWNNLAKPLEFEIRAPESMTISPKSATAPKPKQAADADPREFLVDVEAQETSAPFMVQVRYYACDDANTFCVPVQQEYAVHLEADPLAGVVRERGGRGGGRGGDMAQRLARWDTNGDGKISKEEAPQRMKQNFDRFDANGDGAIDAEEASAMMRRRGAEQGGRP